MLFRDIHHVENIIFFFIILFKNIPNNKTISKNNKNIITIALIQGEPHYFNFILTNETNHQELYRIVVSKNIKKR